VRGKGGERIAGEGMEEGKVGGMIEVLAGVRGGAVGRSGWV
jgi:hypothetical protein